jgi:hypothetical protein
MAEYACPLAWRTSVIRRSLWERRRSGFADTEADDRQVVGLSHVAWDGWCPSRPSDEAEGVTGRVGVDIFAVEFLRAKGQCARLGGGHVFDHDVQVDLLRDRGIRPGGRAMVWGELEGQARGGVVGGHDNPVVALVGDRLPEQLGVEGCQGGRIGTVEHYMVQSSEHAGSMSDAVRSNNRLLSATPNSRPEHRTTEEPDRARSTVTHSPGLAGASLADARTRVRVVPRDCEQSGAAPTRPRVTGRARDRRLMGGVSRRGRSA